MSESKSNPRLTVTVSPEMKQEIDDQAEKRSMSISEYVRISINAGQKQILALEEELEGSEGIALEEKVLNVVPSDSEDALSTEEISDKILEQIEQQIYNLLDSDDRITHSATNGGYYIE